MWLTKIHPPSSWRPIVALVAGAAFLFACAAEAPGKKKKADDGDPDDGFYGTDQEPVMPIEPDKVNANSGAFGAAERPKGSTVGRVDAGVPPTDAGKEYCDPIVRRDLAITELMISSRAGAGDAGEWVEVRNTRACWLKLAGLTVESPRGTAAANIATIKDNFELAPHASFVVAGSAAAPGIPGKVIVWDATDVLKNESDTVIVKMGSLIVDQLTYPSLSNLTPGRALSFPDDCAWSLRGDWARWSLTFEEFAPGFKGTPNAPNDDVSCF